MDNVDQVKGEFNIPFENLKPVDIVKFAVVDSAKNLVENTVKEISDRGDLFAGKVLLTTSIVAGGIGSLVPFSVGRPDLAIPWLAGNTIIGALGAIHIAENMEQIPQTVSN